jgi:hypothetical protein
VFAFGRYRVEILARRQTASNEDFRGFVSSSRHIFYYDTVISPSSRTMALGLTQRLTEMSTRNLPRGKGPPACETDNLTAICEPIV